MKNELKILLASPRGFCAGVDRAIEIVNKALNKLNTQNKILRWEKYKLKDFD